MEVRIQVTRFVYADAEDPGALAVLQQLDQAMAMTSPSTPEPAHRRIRPRQSGKNDSMYSSTRFTVRYSRGAQKLLFL